METIEDLPVLEELDAEPTVGELSKSIDALSSGKAPGEDGIRPEIINIAAERCGQSLRSRGSDPPTSPRQPHLPRVPVLFQGREINGGHDFLRAPTTGEMPRAVDAIIHRLYRTDQGLLPCEQGRSVPAPEEDRVPLQLLSITACFHDDTQATVNYEPFEILSGVKQGCVLWPTLFGIFFAMLLNSAFRHSDEGVHLHTRNEGKLFNLARLKGKTKFRTVLIKEMLFADDAALTSHTEEGLKQLIRKFVHACNEFGLTISIKKTNVMGQDVPAVPSININCEVLEVTDRFLPRFHNHQQSIT